MKRDKKTRQPDLSHLPWGIYKRVSTLDQAEKYSPLSQDRTCRAKAAQNHWPISEQHVFEDHESGTTTERPDFQRMMESVRRREVRGFIVYTVDRLNRSVEDAIKTKKLFANAGVELEFCDFTFEDSPVGDFLFNIMASVARFERDNFMKRSADGRRDKINAGLMTSGSVPMGYRYVPDGGPGGQLVIVEEDARLVRRIFAMYRGGMSLYRITHVLQSEGLKRRSGKQWNRNGVARVLQNATYTGVLTLDRQSDQPVTITVPAIVGRELFEEVNAMLVTNRKARSGRPTHRYLLSGLVCCKACRRRWRIINARTYKPTGKRSACYGCASYQDKYMRTGQPCGSRFLGQLKFDTTVWNMVRHAARTPGFVLKAAEAYHDANKQQGGQEETLVKQIARMDAKIERHRRARVEPDEDWDKHSAAIRTLTDEVRVLKAELRKHTTVLPLPPAKAIEGLAAEFRDGIDACETFEEKRGVLERFVESIETDGREVEITARLVLPEAFYCHGGEHGRDNKSAFITFKIKGRVAA